MNLAGAGGFEPPTTGFGDRRSGQTELRSCVVPLEGFEPPTRDLGRRRSFLTELQGHAGGDRGARTPNLGIANAALSQLSYIPKNSLDGLPA